jgi:hypothetical protein
MNLRPALTALFLILCSCSRSQPSASGAPSASAAAAASAPQASAAASPAASASAAPLDPAGAPSCAFVTKAEAEEILGEPIGLAVLSNGLCEYVRENDPSKHKAIPIAVELDLAGVKSVFESQTQRAADILHTTRTPKPGFGEDAFVIGKHQLAILQHGRSIAITRLAVVDDARFEAFARKALTRL